MYRSLGLDSTEPGQGKAKGLESLANGVHISTAFGIRRPAEEPYAFWRDFENLPRIMTPLESVRVIDDRRSHWVAKPNSLGGKRLEWDAEITVDEPDRRTAWRSFSGGDVENAEQITFSPGLHEDRGTDVDPKKLKVRDRVVVPFPIACGECFFCRRGFHSRCDNTNAEPYVSEQMFGAGPIAGVFGCLVQVYTALQRRNALALAVHESTGETGDAAKLIGAVGPRVDFSNGYTHLAKPAAEMWAVKEAHHFYRVLVYFRFDKPHYTLSRTTAVLLDAATLIESGLDDDGLGLLDAHRVERLKPLATHIDDYEQVVATRKSNTTKHAKRQAGHVRRLIAAINATTVADLTEDHVLGGLAGMKKSVATRRHYIVAAKDFTGRMVRSKRAIANPLAQMQPPSQYASPTIERFPLIIEQLQKLVT